MGRTLDHMSTGSGSAPADAHHALTWQVRDLDQVADHIRASGIGLRAHRDTLFVTEDTTASASPGGSAPSSRLATGAPNQKMSTIQGLTLRSTRAYRRPPTTSPASAGMSRSPAWWAGNLRYSIASGGGKGVEP